MECETYNKMWPLFCRWKGSLLSILFVMEMIQKKLSMQKYWKFLDLRPGTTTSSYVCRMWLWDNWQKLLYFLQIAGMFVPRCDVTPSTMVFQHCTSNNKFYFKAFFIQKILVSPSLRHKLKDRRSLKVIFFSVVDHETIFMWEMNDISHQGSPTVTPPLQAITHGSKTIL